MMRNSRREEETLSFLFRLSSEEHNRGGDVRKRVPRTSCDRQVTAFLVLILLEC